MPVPAGSKETGPRSGRWAHEDFSQKPDSRVIWGRLDNGFRYALLPHRGAPGRVAMKLIVLTGSVDERPAELGLAHFIEHMSFHGTREMDETAMLSLFRRAGLEYGSDVNAVTTFDYTAYSLDFSENTPALLAEGVRWFHGIGDGVTFDANDIDRERRVIFAEKRNHDGLADRQMQASFPVVFRGLTFAERVPIGLEQTLRHLKREQFLDFYRRGYRPDLMVFVMAGDIDPVAMETLVRGQFGQLTRPAAPVPARVEGRPDLKELRAGVFRIPGVGSAEIMAASAMPQPGLSDAHKTAVEARLRAFVMELFGNRLRFMLPGFSDHQADFQSVMHYDSAEASVRADGQAWSNGLLGVDLAVRETLRRGFEAAEIEPLRQHYLDVAAHMAEQGPVLDPVDLCNSLVGSITDHQVYVGPGTDYEWMKDWLQRLTVEEVNQTFRNLWNPEGLAFYVSGDVNMQLTPQEIIKTVQKHRRGELPFLLPAPPKDIVFKLNHPGPATPVIERREVPALGARLMRLGNNVRLNVVSNKQEPGLVRAIVRVGTGLLALPGRQPALKEFGLNTLLGSGTIYYQTDQINQIIDRRFLEFSFDVNDHDAFTFRGTMGVDNLETFLGLTTEILREPKFNPYAHEDERNRAYMSRASSDGGMGQGMREMMDTLFRGDARFMSGTPLDYISLGVADVKRWMEGPLTTGYIEVTIVGDVTEETASSITSRTLGTLPLRAAEKILAEPPKPVQMTAPAGYQRIEFIGELNLGVVIGNWPVEGNLDARAQAALQVLTKVLELRVRGTVRDGLGFSYSPSATFKPFGGFEDFALLQATVDCTPGDARQVATAVETTAAKLAAEGATAEEFDGARGIMRRQLRRAFRDNDFLVNALKRAQEKSTKIEDVVALQDGLVDQLTLAEINTWAAKVLPAANCRTAALVPKAFVGLFDNAK
jgi:zinc protease